MSGQHSVARACRCWGRYGSWLEPEGAGAASVMRRAEVERALSIASVRKPPLPEAR